MRRTWIFIWLVLILLQLATYWWVGRNRVYTSASGIPVMEAGLLELTRNVKSLYEAELSASGTIREISHDKGTGSVLEREEVLFRLRDSESELRSRGLDVHLASELEAWLKEMEKRQVVTRLDEAGAFLGTLTEWVTQLADGRTGSITRAFLLPSGTGEFPVLSFEAHGPTEQLVGCLVSLPEHDPRWNLDEFDLLIEHSKGDSWVRGIFAFEGKEAD